MKAKTKTKQKQKDQRLVTFAESKVSMWSPWKDMAEAHGCQFGRKGWVGAGVFSDVILPHSHMIPDVSCCYHTGMPSSIYLPGPFRGWSDKTLLPASYGMSSTTRGNSLCCYFQQWPNSNKCMQGHFQAKSYSPALFPAARLCLLLSEC
jgi:hypothetical protein